MNTRDLNFLFLSLLSFSLSLVSHHKKCFFLLCFPSSVGLAFVFGKRGGLSPLQYIYDDDDDVNENDDWVCKNNDYCFHPDIIIVIIAVAKKKKKDHHRAAVVRVLPR